MSQDASKSAKKAESAVPAVIPEGANKVKEYREKAGKTQNQVQQGMKAGANFISLVECGKRQFTASERAKFFGFLGLPEDTSIPVKADSPRKAKAAKGVKQPKAPKAPKALKSVKAPKAVKAPKVAKVPREKKPAAAKTPKQPKAVLVAAAPNAIAPVVAKVPAPKKLRASSGAPRGRRPAGVQVQDVLVKTPAKTSVALSPVKEAAMSDMGRVFANPSLSDAQAKRLHNLFTSLAVTVLMEG
jgi:transcriptional regulator with XRE-family HTH domain